MTEQDFPGDGDGTLPAEEEPSSSETEAPGSNSLPQQEEHTAESRPFEDYPDPGNSDTKKINIR